MHYTVVFYYISPDFNVSGSIKNVPNKNTTIDNVAYFFIIDKTAEYLLEDTLYSTPFRAC